MIITVGAKLSGTNQSARTALAEAPGGDVYVVDSNNVTLVSACWSSMPCA